MQADLIFCESPTEAQKFLFGMARLSFCIRNSYSEFVFAGTAVQSEERQAEELEEVNEEPMSEENGLSKWLYPPEEELPDDKEMTIFDHLEELRDRLLISVVAVGVAIAGCFVFAKDLIVLLEKPVYSLGVRFLALSPGEYFFTTLKVQRPMIPSLQDFIIDRAF